MENSLFRQEALDATKHTLLGAVSLFSPPYRWLVISIISALTLSIALFFILGSYTKRESVSGELIPSEGVFNVSPPLGGTVVSTLVKEGQAVSEGDPLMVISAEVVTAFGSTREVIGEQLRQQRKRIEIDLAGNDEMSVEELKGLKRRAAMLKQQLSELALQREQRVRQSDLANLQLDKLKSMRDQGYASNSQVEQQEAVAIDASARLQDLSRQRLDTQQQLTEVDQQQREQPFKARNMRHDLKQKLAELDQSLAENESRRSIILRAPKDSVVGALLVKSGQVVNAGQTALSLVPKGAQLEARLLVPSRAIGFVRPKQQVVLRYQAYPYQKFGQHYGHVTEVSHTALSPQEVLAMTGQQGAQEQQYRVTVRLDRQQVEVYDRTEPLRPGMALDADLLIDNRRLIEWVLEPLYALGRRAAS
ncbi:MAG: HlyD family secretion protein [Pseudomonas sp.]|nr:HlyD family secretion protein [Pseudomonas sp.]